MIDTEELKKKLGRQYEELVERIVGQQKGFDEITLEDIEEAALAIGRAVQETVTSELITQSEAQERGKPATCPTCGGRMRRKGYREKNLITRSGEAKIKREYWYCEACGRGIFPPGQTLEAE